MRRPLLAVLAAAALAGPARAAKPGTSGADFLQIGAGARQAGMGEAAAALADDAAAAYWNPAGLGTLARQEAAFHHVQWFQGVSYENLIYAQPHARYGGFAAQLGSLSYGAIDGYGEGGERTGSVSAGDRQLGVAWGSPLLADRLRVGVGAKMLQETLASRSASAFAADLGALAKLWETPGASVQAAAGLRHLGGGLKFDAESAPLPRTAYLGVSFRGFEERLAADLDISQPRDDGMKAALGAEFWLHPMVAFRAGWKAGRDAGSGLNTGVGLRVGRLHVDYALSDFGDLGLAHRVSVSWKFGGLTEDLYAKGRELMAQGRWAEAILQFNRVLQVEPRHRRALLRVRECRDKLAEQKKEEIEKP